MSASASVTIAGSRLAEPPRAPDLALQRERLLELDADLSPRLHAQRVCSITRRPEAGVGVDHFAFGPRDGATLIVRRQRSSSTVQPFASPYLRT
jgi:hypothetical protein